MSRHRTPIRNAAALAIVAVAFLGACTPADDGPTPTSVETTTPTKTATPTPTADADVVAAQEAALEAYRGYWDAKVVAFADPAAEESPDLAHFAVDTALADVRAGVQSLKSGGIAVTGTPVLAPELSEITLDGTPSGTIVDCVDVGDWQPVYVATNESAADPDQARRVLTTSTAYFYDGHWTIRSSDVDRDASC